ncbi:MAG: tRNA (adenosine(37)-N6)-dimethylallyltransferase MiaA [Candidatus Saccharibacteria bacterium]|nr:tRNA (adenosine(37)-N6)-dimethylallyltransferase MiaA [Candidatus Saccharibacteria bacterium]
MDTSQIQVPLVVIVGETASGKSALGLELAKRFHGEIICADSRTIYKGMDIGTAKPSLEERAMVPHHLLDVVEPGQPFTAADFKVLANQSITDIAARGKLPIMVGGSGLYIDSVLFDFEFGAVGNPAQRAQLEALSIEKLQSMVLEQGVPMPENRMNKRYLVRALERGKIEPKKAPLRNNTLVLGLAPERPVLNQRIQERVDAMIATGLEAEARGLAGRYGWETEAMKGVGYQEFKQALQDETVRERIIQNTRKLAKRQRTWFKRNPSVQYVTNLSQAVELVTTFLSKNQ